VRGLLKIPEKKQIIKLCPFSFVDLLRALESPNVQSAEDKRSKQIIQLCPFSFVYLLRASWNHQMCSQLKTPEEQQIIKLCLFSFVDLLRALESPCAAC
jgi:hypothetical protein